MNQLNSDNGYVYYASTVNIIEVLLFLLMMWWSPGVGSLPYFSDDDEESGDSSSQDEKSEGDDSEDNDADFGGLLEDQLERRTSSSKSDVTVFTDKCIPAFIEKRGVALT